MSFDQITWDSLPNYYFPPDCNMSDISQPTTPSSSSAFSPAVANPDSIQQQQPALENQRRSSGLQPLAPQPAIISRRATPDVAITTASASSPGPSGPAPVGGGPANKSYAVPPRPKPGRKPATDEPASKRKAQNRESQRNFRLRKAQAVADLQAEVEAACKKYDTDIASLRSSMGSLQNKCSTQNETIVRITRERDFWREQCEKLQSSNSTMRHLDELCSTTTARQDSLSQGTGYRSDNTFMGGSCQNGDCQGRPFCICFAQMSSLDNNNNASLGSDAGLINMAVITSSMADATSISGTTHMPVDSRNDSFDYGANQQSTSLESSPFNITRNVMLVRDIQYDDMEIDMNIKYASKRPRLNKDTPIALATQSSEASNDGGLNEEPAIASVEAAKDCGFCTDSSHCPCQDSLLMKSADMNTTAVPDPTPTSNTSAKEAGSCFDCQRDPKQKAWCRRVAELKGSASRDYLSISPTSQCSRESSMSSLLDVMEPRLNHAPVETGQSIGCRDAYKLFKGRLSDNNMDISKLNPISSPDKLTSAQEPRNYSALELDTAGVIATLQHSVKPLTPREEDGSHADLVRIAQDHQRTCASP